MTQEFAITLKFNNKPDCVPSDYLKVRAMWYEQYDVVIRVYFFEKSEAGVCHLHGIVDVPKNFYRKNLKLHGLHVKLVPMFSVPGWLSYCQKNQRKYSKVPRRSPTDRSANITKDNKFYTKKENLLDISDVMCLLGDLGKNLKRDLLSSDEDR